MSKALIRDGMNDCSIYPSEESSEIFTWEEYRIKAQSLGLELKVHEHGGFELNELMVGTLKEIMAIIDWEEDKV